MAVLVCKICGGELNVISGTSIAKCENCDAVQTVPKIDNQAKANIYNRAVRLLKKCEFDRAAVVFRQLTMEYPEEAEAYWGLVLCKYGIECVEDDSVDQGTIPEKGQERKYITEYLQDGRLKRYIPTCHRTSFVSVEDDDDYAQAKENADPTAARLYRNNAILIESLREDIIRVSEQEEDYDVFISLKVKDNQGQRTEDSVLAQDIYNALEKEGYRVFFSPISLLNKASMEYEPYIFAALNSARVMLLISTNETNFEEVWVKNEWMRFLKLMEAHRDKELVVCHKNIDLIPEELIGLEQVNVAQRGYIQDILQYLERTIGDKKVQKVPIERPEDEKIRKAQQCLVDGNFNAAMNILEPLKREAADRYEVWWGLVAAMTHNFSLSQVGSCDFKIIEEYSSSAFKLADPDSLLVLKAQWAAWKSNSLEFQDHLRGNIDQYQSEYDDKLSQSKKTIDELETSIHALNEQIRTCDEEMAQTVVNGKYQAEDVGKGIFTVVFGSLIGYWHVCIFVFIILYGILNSLVWAIVAFVILLCLFAGLLTLGPILGVTKDSKARKRQTEIRAKKARLIEKVTEQEHQLSLQRKRIEVLQRQYERKMTDMQDTLNNGTGK